jgi:hypothetical protein
MCKTHLFVDHNRNLSMNSGTSMLRARYHMSRGSIPQSTDYFSRMPKQDLWPEKLPMRAISLV